MFFGSHFVFIVYAKTVMFTTCGRNGFST